MRYCIEVNKWVFLPVFILSFCCLTSCSPADQFSAKAASISYQKLRSILDSEYPGRGIADYPGFEISDVPKAYAMVMLAEFERRKHHSEHNLNLAISAGNWLLENADENGDGIPGWGVPVAWDAYGDGTENPANTEYSISTGMVVRALLDWSEIDSSAPHDEINQIISVSLSRWADPRLLSPAGLLPYSLAESDQRYDTFNPAAYLAGQMQRFSLKVDKTLGEKLKDAADMTMQALLKHRKIDSGGGWFWMYSIQEDNPNDLAHAIYIIDGIVAYVRYNGRLRHDFDIPKIKSHLQTFLRDNNDYVSAWPVFHKRINYPARSYDIGIGLWFTARDPVLGGAIAQRLAQHIPAYQKPDGYYRKYPQAGDKKDGDDLAVGEYQAYILAGLAAWAGSEK